MFCNLLEAEDGTLTEIPGSEKLYPADSVIVSISQGPCTTITEDEKELIDDVNPVAGDEAAFEETVEESEKHEAE